MVREPEMPQRPVSNPGALDRPGLGENDISGAFNNRSTGEGRRSDLINPAEYRPKPIEQFNSYVGEGNSFANGVVPNKVFNGQAPTRANPNMMKRYEYAKHLREFRGF